MGRIYTAPTINKSVINNAITSTLSAVYTNATGAGAELRAVNINGLQNNATINSTASGAQEWSMFGSNVNPIVSISSAGTGTGFGEPYQVQLSANRILLFFLPHSHHRCGQTDKFGGNTIHTQIVEYQTNKYVAGPIQTHLLPFVWFNNFNYSLWSMPNSSSTVHSIPCWRATALTATKVAVVCRQTNANWLMRFTITGNTVDHLVGSLDLGLAANFNVTTTTGPFAIDTVPGDTTKLMVMMSAVTNWKAMVFNVPDTGAPTAASTLLDLGIAHAGTYYSCGMTKMVKTATSFLTPYLFVAATSATTSTALVYSFNSSTNAWTNAGNATAQSLNTVNANHTTLECACLSTGTNVNAVIMSSSGSGAGDGIMWAYRQTSISALNYNTPTSIYTQTTQWKGVADHYQWGDERVVFVGDYGLLVCYDSAGNGTSLITVMDSVDTSQYIPKWFPFNSRPLYTFYDPQTKNLAATTSYKSRINSTGTTTSLGSLSHTGNYLPWGFDYGEGYAWNDLASCWVVCQGQRIYALSTAGVVLSELNILNLSGVTTVYAASQIQVTPTGRLLLGFDYDIKVKPVLAQSPGATNGGYSAGGIGLVTEPMTTTALLPTLKLQQAVFGFSSNLLGQMVYFTDSGGTENAYMPFVRSNSTLFSCAWFNGSTWSLVGNFGITTPISGIWSWGYRFNIRMIQDTPCSSAYPRGLWRLMGSTGLDTTAKYLANGISVPYDQASFGSLNSNTYPLSASSLVATQGWGTPYHVHNSLKSGTVVATMYDEFSAMPRIYSSVNGRLSDPQGWYVPQVPIYATTTSTNLFTVPSTAGFYAGQAVQFNGTQIGGVTVTSKTYFINSGFTSTQFSVSAQLIVTAANGSLLTVASTTGFIAANTAITFYGCVPSGCTLSTGVVYYVNGASITGTQFSVAATSGGTVLTVGTSGAGIGFYFNATQPLSTASGSTMTMSVQAQNRWGQCVATKMGYAISLQNTAFYDQQAFVYNFNTVDSITPNSTQVATIGSGWVVLYKTGKNSWQLYNSTASLNYTYSAYGIPDEVKFYLTLDDNAGNVFYLNNGQTLSPTDTTTGLFRSETVYKIPNLYSIKDS